MYFDYATLDREWNELGVLVFLTFQKRLLPGNTRVPKVVKRTYTRFLWKRSKTFSYFFLNLEFTMENCHV